MALINDPILIFLDEPTSGLDVQSSRVIRDILLEFPKEGKTIFLTTHNMDEANHLCDRVAIINHGKIAAIDRPATLKNMIKRLNSAEIPYIRNITKEGDKFIISTEDVDNLIHSLADFAESRKLKIINLNTMAPSLEEVFIKLTRET